MKGTAGEAISPPDAILVIYLAAYSDGARSVDDYSLCFLLREAFF